jgi:hypothetical protein
MQLFELVSPRLFRPLAGPNRAFYAELLLLLSKLNSMLF